MIIKFLMQFAAVVFFTTHNFIELCKLYLVELQKLHFLQYNTQIIVLLTIVTRTIFQIFSALPTTILATPNFTMRISPLIFGVVPTNQNKCSLKASPNKMPSDDAKGETFAFSIR